jgi:hypothetical protein
MIKSIFKIVMAATAAIALSVATDAQTITPPAAKSYFTANGPVGTTISSAIISANGAGTPLVSYVNATADNSTNKLVFYTSTAGVQITAAGASGQAVVTAVGTGNFSANDVTVVRHVSSDTYERLVVSSATATNVTFTANLAAAVVSGDFVYKQTVGPLIVVGAATKELNAFGGGFVVGTEARPILVDLTGAAACTLNAISGVYKQTSLR